MEKNDKIILKLVYIGDDGWSRPIYRDQFDCLWKDIDLMNLGGEPSLCSVTNNEIDGEPEEPMNPEIKYEFQEIKDSISEEKKFQYQMLSMLKSCCDYYLGYGNRYAGHLSGEDEKTHLEAMKKIWMSFAENEKPEWLTWDQLERYGKEMLSET